MSRDVAYAIRRKKSDDSENYWLCIGDTPEKHSAMVGQNLEMVLVGPLEPIETAYLRSEDTINRIKSIVEDYGQGIYGDSDGKPRDIRSAEAKVQEIRRVLGSKAEGRAT